MGLGSIVGTGLFVSLGIAAGVAGSGILLALPLAAFLALFNGLSSAQLAAAHPVSGGTYAYGRRFVSEEAGFAAGALFLLAKSASAATAALGLAGYLLLALGVDPGRGVRVALAGGGVVLLTVLVAGGISRSNRANALIVGVTLAGFAGLLAVGGWRGLAVLGGVEGGVAGGLTRLAQGASGWYREEVAGRGAGALFHATALLFVAYTGYGRIATLGEEVRDPARTIPRAIAWTLGVVAVLYLGVAALALATLGAEGFARETAATAAPLQAVAQTLQTPGLGVLVSVAAVSAMAGVLLNLLLGLSRVAFAMGRAGDLPSLLGRVHTPTASPRMAVWLTGGVILALVLVGDVRLTWGFSAFTVLGYYGITNLAALRLPPESRRYPRVVPLLGLGGCVFLALFIPPGVAAAGVGAMVVAFGTRWGVRRLGRGRG
jgi:APA family basic amino acid/polyamine antiporter